MAITKLMHMKEGLGDPPQHLRNGIEYILNPQKTKGKKPKLEKNPAMHLENGVNYAFKSEKTEQGLYVGGNVGTTPGEVLNAFQETKRFYGKENGRQGYHFVISFKPGECDRDTCYKVAEEFCKNYLGDDYEYVFAVHDDKEHIHAHIIFNSVSRSTGLKYRYEKGDWEKHIQPVTDKVCEKFGLPPLEYEEVRKGMNYAKWLHGKDKEKMNWKHIVMADVDYAIDHAGGRLENFLSNMKEMGYSARLGTRRGERDISFTMVDGDGKKRSKRLSSLPVGYNYMDVVERLRQPEAKSPEFYKEIENVLQTKTSAFMRNAAVLKGTNSYRRLYQAVNYYSLPNPYAVPASRVRTDMKRIDKLLEQCTYLKRHLQKEKGSIREKASQIDHRLHALYVRRKELYQTREQYLGTDLEEQVKKYMELKEQLKETKEWGAYEESLQENLWEMEKQIPAAIITNENDLLKCKHEIASLVKEKRILSEILSTETQDIKAVTLEAEKKPSI